MRPMRHFLCALVYAIAIACVALLLVVTPQSTDALPSWRCRVCEDVVQTWHDKYPCAGNYLQWGNPISPDIKACKGPEFDCNRLNGEIKSACFSMVEQFATQDLIAKDIWEEMMLKNDAYATCIKMGKCKPEANLPEPTKCHKAFRDPYCKYDWKCKNMTAECDDTCYLCNWLIRDWPIFQESCKPEGAKLPDYVPLPSDKFPSPPGKSKFLEMESVAHRSHQLNWDRARYQSQRFGRRRRTRRGFRRGYTDQEEGSGMELNDDAPMEQIHTPPHQPLLRRMGRAESVRFAESLQGQQQQAALAEAAYARAQAELAVAKAKGGGASSAKTKLQTGFTKTEQCFRVWNELKTTAKARYFASWKRYVNIMSTPMDRLKGSMWDANVVCKCLGHCELSRFEDLGLIEACRYGEAEQQEMSYIFKDEGLLTQ